MALVPSRLRGPITKAIDGVMALCLDDVATQALLDQEAAKFTEACKEAKVFSKPWTFTVACEDGRRVVTVGFAVA